MENSELREDLKSLDEKLDQIMLQVALNTERIKNIPDDIKTAALNIQLKYAAILIMGGAGGIWYLAQTFIPTMIENMIKAQA